MHSNGRRTWAREAAALGGAPILSALCALSALYACQSPAGRPGTDTARGASRSPEARSEVQRVGTIINFRSPESVRYDPELDVFYVSNMYLYGSAKDNNGYIVRLDAANLQNGRVLVQGGVNGVTLNAPKGLALHGDTLWVTDIDALRGFDRRSGAPLATIDFTPQRATLLNDVAIGPDGTIRVTDTGIVMSKAGVVYDTTGDRVFRVGPGGSISAIPAGAPHPKPNGITWDPKGKRWLVVTFDPFASKLYAMGAEETTRTPVSAGKGRWDGVEVLGDGRVVLSSWSDSSIHLVDGGRDRQIIRHVPAPADIGIDTKRNRIAIPLGTSNRVEFWTLPAR